MAENKKKRKKAAKRQTTSRPVESQAASVQPTEPEVLDTTGTELDASQQAADENLDPVDAEQIDQEVVVEATSPYDDLITHRTSSQPTGDMTSAKIKSGLAAAVQIVRTRKPWLWLGGIILVVILSLTIWWQWQRSYVGVVNGQYIPTTELLSFTLSSGGSDALTQLTQQHLITQEAYHQNIHISDEVLQTELQKIVDESGGQEAYEQALQQYGIPEEHLVNQIRTKQILVELTKDQVSVTDQEVEDYYNSNRETLDPDGSRGFDNIKELIRIQLTEQKQEAEFATYVQNLTEKSTITNNLGHATLTFGQFLDQEIFSIPGDIASLFDFSN